MSDHKPEETFRVIDRRLFTESGELRKEALENERHEKDSAAKGEPKQPQQSPVSQVPASEAPKRSPAFESLVRMLGSNAAMVLGAYADPRTGQPIVDPDAAHELIDMLDALHEKTRGNLAPEEENLLVDLSAKLKMTYLEISQSTAQAAAQGRGKSRG